MPSKICIYKLKHFSAYSNESFFFSNLCVSAFYKVLYRYHVLKCVCGLAIRSRGVHISLNVVHSPLSYEKNC